MKKSEFINLLVDYCEFEPQEISFNTTLKSIEGYDSLAIMSIIAFAHEKFGRKLNAVQLQELTDINSLIELIGHDKFEDDKSGR